MHSNQDFLNDIVRLVGLTSETQRPPVDLAVVHLDEIFEGGSVAPLRSPYQIRNSFVQPVTAQQHSEVVSFGSR